MLDWSSFGAVLGHNFPVFLNFKEKNACTSGVILLYSIRSDMSVLFYSLAVPITDSLAWSILLLYRFCIHNVFKHMGCLSKWQYRLIDILAAVFTAMASATQAISETFKRNENKFVKAK